MDLPLAIGEGINTTKLIAERYGFEERQSNYYLEAAEILGLLARRGTKFALSDQGKKYLLMDISERKLVLVRKMIMVPIINRVLAEILARYDKLVSKKDLENLTLQSSPTSGSTVTRRAQTIISWFRWLGEQTEVFQVDFETIQLGTGKGR